MPSIPLKLAAAFIVFLYAAIAAANDRGSIERSIANLTALDEQNNLQADGLFELGTLHWSRRDYARNTYEKNDMARQASRYFARYGREDALMAFKSTSLFCLERVRQSETRGIRVAEEFSACSSMASRYIATPQLDPEILAQLAEQRQASAEEAIYDISYRFSDWPFLSVKRLGDSLLESELVELQTADIEQAYIVSLETRLGLNHMKSGKVPSDQDYREAMEQILFMLEQPLSMENRDQLETLLGQVYMDTDMVAGMGRELMRQAMSALYEAKAAMIVYHLEQQRLPAQLSDTAYDPSGLPAYIDDISLQGSTLALTFSSHVAVPSALTGRALTREIRVSKQNTLLDECSASSDIPSSYLPAELGCI